MGRWSPGEKRGTEIWEMEADGVPARTAELTTETGVMLRPNVSQARPQKGFTTTRMTMITTATPGTSFMILSALPLTGRIPRSSFLP